MMKGNMHPVDVIKRAKKCIHEFFGKGQNNSKISNIDLEEIEFDFDSGVWKVTVGFDRSQKSPKSQLNPIASVLGNAAYLANSRKYKVVEIRDEDGSINRVFHRELTA